MGRSETWFRRKRICRIMMTGMHGTRRRKILMEEREVCVKSRVIFWIAFLRGGGGAGGVVARKDRNGLGFIGPRRALFITPACAVDLNIGVCLRLSSEGY